MGQGCGPMPTRIASLIAAPMASVAITITSSGEPRGVLRHDPAFDQRTPKPADSASGEENRSPERQPRNTCSTTTA